MLIILVAVPKVIVGVYVKVPHFVVPPSDATYVNAVKGLYAAEA